MLFKGRAGDHVNDRGGRLACFPTALPCSDPRASGGMTVLFSG